MNQAKIEAAGPDGYLTLCEILHNTDFYARIEMDKNRAKDGIALRDEWAEDEVRDKFDQAYLVYELDKDLSESTCTVMELFLILARSMQYETLESQFEASIRKWFTELLLNCGLGAFTNRAFEEDVSAENKVGDILKTLMWRRYGWDGEGGLFPLVYAQCDQRFVELAIQMNRYIEENYDIC